MEIFNIILQSQLPTFNQQMKSKIIFVEQEIEIDEDWEVLLQTFLPVVDNYNKLIN